MNPKRGAEPHIIRLTPEEKQMIDQVVAASPSKPRWRNAMVVELFRREHKRLVALGLIAGCMALAGCGSSSSQEPADTVIRAECVNDTASATTSGNTEDIARRLRAIAHETQYRQEIIAEVLPQVMSGDGVAQLSAPCLGGGYVEFILESDQ